MRKFWNVGSLLIGFLSLIVLPMTAIIYKDPTSSYYKYLKFSQIIFRNREFGIKFNILLILVFLIIILSGFVRLLFKNKQKGYLYTMLSYLVGIILTLFTKVFFFAINDNTYKFYARRINNGLGYAVLVLCIICALGLYFSYMSFAYEVEDTHKNK